MCYFVVLFQFINPVVKTFALIVFIELLIILLSVSNLVQFTN